MVILLVACACRQGDGACQMTRSKCEGFEGGNQREILNRDLSQLV